MTIGLYGGSFDCYTKGHAWVVERAASIFDKVVIVIATNSEKKGMFTPEHRKQLIDHCVRVAGLPHKVEVVISTNSFVANVAKQYEATHLIRGIRDAKDFEYEKTIASVNRDINSNLETIYLIPPDHISKISSSLAKSFLGLSNYKKVLRNYVDICVYNALVMKHEHYDSYFYNEIYTDPKRAYHNVIHLESMWSNITSFMDTTQELGYRAEVTLKDIVYYHDLVYDPVKNDNEENSWFKYENMSIRNGGYSEEVLKNAKEAILATKDHLHNYDSSLITRLVCDADLAILGSEPDDYEWYRKCVREEYYMYPDSIFYSGRLQFLKKMGSAILERGYLYNLPWFRDRYETNAIRSITREIQALEKRI